MKTNEELQREVQDAINFDPELEPAEIGIAVHNGVVTLTGTVTNYVKKLLAEKATKSVAGVKAIVEKIDVKLPDAKHKTDEEIAHDALMAIRDKWNVPDSRIKLKVEKGFVTLEGKTGWFYQRESAERAIQMVAGVRGIYNHLEIDPHVKSKVEKELIEKAFDRHWSIDAEHIDVKANGNKVTLTGRVTSIYQREEAGRIAWKTPGVWQVENNLVVDYHRELAL